MLSKDYRLRLSAIACKTRLNREVSLEDRIWAQKLVEPVSYTHLTLPTSDLV